MDILLGLLLVIAAALILFGRERQTNRCPPCPRCPPAASAQPKTRETGGGAGFGGAGVND